MRENFKENHDITHLSNFKTPAQARYFFSIDTAEDTKKLPEIYAFCKNQALPLLMISGGTNMLFAFEIFPGVVIKNNLSGWRYDNSSKLLTSYSNESIRKIASALEDDFGQNLWHRFIGLPGSVGGAVFGNAGCFGLEIENNFLSAQVLNLITGKILKLEKKDMNFSYRSSILKQKEGTYFLLSATFDLSEKKEKYHSDVDNVYFREYKQPKGLNCGSFFKNPSREQSAGYLIEQVGLKGYKIGGAYFHQKHANFLSNDGTATYKNLLDLIKLAQEKVLKEFGVHLENEVRIIHP